MMKNCNDSWKEVSGLYASLAKIVSTTNNTLLEGVAIFGAGVQGRVAMHHLKKQGIKILCFTDNDDHKHGTIIDNIPVVSPHDPTVASAPVVLIAARHAVQPLRRQLDDMGVTNLSFDAYFVARNMDRISRVRNDFLKDDRSRFSYDGILKTILTGDNSYCASVMENNQYFALPEFMDFGKDHFVDAGAYVGDTLERFIWMTSGVFVQIYAFEPGASQMDAMKHRVERLRKEWAISESAIICENAGLADKNETLTISMPGVPANMSIHHDSYDDETPFGRIHCYSLDSYLAGRPATFIKADIEGMELEMLHGGQETIRRYKPKMALSIYHNPTHLFEIAEYVHWLAPEYRMAIRHHSPIFAESILYCWIP
jgi:FkbM family methyltransferase